MANKWQAWYDSLPSNTKENLKGRPLWSDRDLAVFVSIALAVGFFLGYIV